MSLRYSAHFLPGRRRSERSIQERNGNEIPSSAKVLALSSITSNLKKIAGKSSSRRGVKLKNSIPTRSMRASLSVGKRRKIARKTSSTPVRCTRPFPSPKSTIDPLASSSSGRSSTITRAAPPMARLNLGPCLSIETFVENCQRRTSRAHSSNEYGYVLSCAISGIHDGGSSPLSTAWPWRY